MKVENLEVLLLFHVSSMNLKLLKLAKSYFLLNCSVFFWEGGVKKNILAKHCLQYYFAMIRNSGICWWFRTLVIMWRCKTSFFYQPNALFVRILLFWTEMVLSIFHTLLKNTHFVCFHVSIWLPLLLIYVLCQFHLAPSQTGQNWKPWRSCALMYCFCLFIFFNH